MNPTQTIRIALEEARYIMFRDHPDEVSDPSMYQDQLDKALAAVATLERQQEAPATRLSEEELKRLTDFWESAWEDEGTREKIINELHDYTVFMDNTTKVYDHLTRGNITKINTLPQAVIDEVERIHQQEIDEAVREAEVEEVRGLSVEQGKDLLRAINAGAWERIDGALRVNAVSQEHVTQCFKDVGIELEPPF